MEHDYYRRRIRLPGPAEQFISAKLTYCLGKEGAENERIFLLTDFPRNLIRSELKVYWEKLIAEINRFSTGNIQQDKYLVNKIKNEPHQYPHWGVAIHHFGPVPVLRTGYLVKQEFHGREVDAEVVVYYNRSQNQNSQLNFIFPNKSFFLESLLGSYSLIMQRYFEDVAKLVNDIALESSLTNAFEWSKLAEDYIGQSIQSKIKESIPAIEDWQRYLENLPFEDETLWLRCHLFEEHHVDIFLAQYFRATVLYLLNEFYRHLGLESRSKTYSERLLEIYKEYDKFFGADSAENLLLNFDNAGFLRDLRICYQQNNLHGLKDLKTDTVWQKGLQQFCQFLLNLQRNPLPAKKGRIFISYNHRVPSSDQIKKQVEDFYISHFKNSVEILSVSSLPVNAVFSDAIKTLIWQSDRVLVIVPKDPAKLGSGEPGNYHWLAREAEHALMLKKRVTYLIEEGTNRKDIELALGNPEMEFLVPEIGNHQLRVQSLLKDFKERIQVTFDLKGNITNPTWNDLRDDIQKALAMHSEKATARRHHNMMKGFLAQFSKDTLIMLRCLQMLPELKSMTPKADIIGAIYKKFGVVNGLKFSTKSEIRNAFNNAWNQTRTRAFQVDDKTFTLMVIEQESSSKFNYQFTLPQLLSALQNNLSEERLNSWVISLFDQVLPDSANNIFNKFTS